MDLADIPALEHRLFVDDPVAHKAVRALGEWRHKPLRRKKLINLLVSGTTQGAQKVRTMALEAISPQSQEDVRTMLFPAFRALGALGNTDAFHALRLSYRLPDFADHALIYDESLNVFMLAASVAGRDVTQGVWSRSGLPSRTAKMWGAMLCAAAANGHTAITKGLAEEFCPVVDLSTAFARCFAMSSAQTPDLALLCLPEFSPPNCMTDPIPSGLLQWVQALVQWTGGYRANYNAGQSLVQYREMLTNTQLAPQVETWSRRDFWEVLRPVAAIKSLSDTQVRSLAAAAAAGNKPDILAALGDQVTYPILLSVVIPVAISCRSTDVLATALQQAMEISPHPASPIHAHKTWSSWGMLFRNDDRIVDTASLPLWMTFVEGWMKAAPPENDQTATPCDVFAANLLAEWVHYGFNAPAKRLLETVGDESWSRAHSAAGYAPKGSSEDVERWVLEHTTPKNTIPPRPAKM